MYVCTAYIYVSIKYTFLVARTVDDKFEESVAGFGVEGVSEESPTSHNFLSAQAAVFGCFSSVVVTKRSAIYCFNGILRPGIDNLDMSLFARRLVKSVCS